MAAQRRGQSPLNLTLPKTRTVSSSGPLTSDFPPISALFLIYFDIKAGYTIGWKRSLPDVELEGVVEYKSLPSGLHTVKEDLIYFIHGDNAGLSAFVNAPAEEADRNARMIAVGVMVPLSYGRLGRSWKHADRLKVMARELIIDTSKTEVLEKFWADHKLGTLPDGKETDSAGASPTTTRSKPRQLSPSRKGHNRLRSASDSAANLLNPRQTLSTYHPAWSLPNLLETFGPLIFPIYRAALLRKRILITAHAPVAEVCNFVYDISVLSNIPLAVCDFIDPTGPPQRLRPLFCIGVHDIPYLEEDLRASKAAATTPGSVPSDDRGCGWIACTTDSILAMKSTLYDVLITLPPSYSAESQQKVWPRVESPQGMEMKATQRDLRRYKALRWGLSRPNISPSSPQSSIAHSSSDEEDETDTTTLISPSSTQRPPETPSFLEEDIPSADQITEPTSWSALAYSGFMWWASAGEQRVHYQEEVDMDSTLLCGLNEPITPTGIGHRRPSSGSQSHRRSSMSIGNDDATRKEMAIIAYFHRLTTQILTVLGEVVDTSEDDQDASERGSHDERALLPSDADDEGPVVWVTSQDVVRMGLDIWSVRDRQWVEELGSCYFARRTRVEGRGVDICGVRVC